MLTLKDKKLSFNYTISQDETSANPRCRKARFIAIQQCEKSLDLRKAFGSPDDRRKCKGNGLQRNHRSHTIPKDSGGKKDIAQLRDLFASRDHVGSKLDTPSRHRQQDKVTSSPSDSTPSWDFYEPGSRLASLPRRSGRKGRLTPEVRRNAALMRACSNCKKFKTKCDRGTPCQHCVHLSKRNLLKEPCNRRPIPNTDLSKIPDFASQGTRMSHSSLPDAKSFRPVSYRHMLQKATEEYENDRWRIIASKVGGGFTPADCRGKAEELESMTTKSNGVAIVK